MSAPAAAEPTSIMLLDGRPIEYLVRGTDSPVTVFAHGLADDIDQLAGLARDVVGSRAFFHFGGHGRSQAPSGPLRYSVLATELLAVAERTGADRAVGLSMGAGAVLTALLRAPGRFSRAVVLLPATFDRRGADEPFLYFADLAEAVERGDAGTAARMLLRLCPPMPREAAEEWTRQRARFMVEHGYAARLREVGSIYPVQHPEELSQVDVPVLVLTHQGDLAHSVSTAERLVAGLPDARLHVLGERALLTSGRAEARALIAEFLAG